MSYKGDRTTGFASPASDELEGPIDLSDLLNLTRPSRYPVRVRGLSFAERGILDDDILIVDTDSIPRSGRLVIASLAGRVILAELQERPDGWWLLSGSQEREPVKVDEQQDVEIWASVTGLVRDMGA